MSNLLYVTHLQPSLSSLQKKLQQEGLLYHHTPLVREAARVISVPQYRDYAIVTSFTAIAHVGHMLNLFDRVYCIGRQTADYAQSFLTESTILSVGNELTPSLEALIKKEHSIFSELKGTWYGSSAGAYKHRALFTKYPDIDLQITHWNWPDYDAAAELAQRINQGILICSSISAATAIGSVTWHENVQCIVSAGRLTKHIPLTSCKKIEISSNWTNDFISQHL